MGERTARDRQPPTLDHRTVTGLARQVVGRHGIERVRFQVHPVADWTGPATAGVYRVAGTAWERDREVAWSLILKVLARGPEGLAPNERVPASKRLDHVLYWKREALVYQSRLLDDLPGGVTGPRCYRVMERPDRSVWLWLEEVRDQYGPRWPLEQYARAAACLGRMNGAYLAGQPPPTYPWLVRTGSPRGLLEHFGEMWAMVDVPRTWDHPLVRAAFPVPIASRLRRLWGDRSVLLDIFEGLPQTFCHLDAWRRNLFAPPPGDGQDRLIAIDWAFPGMGTVATDIGDLFAASYGFFGVEPCDPRTLDTVIFDSYLEGLEAAGWRGERRMVRIAFGILASLKYGCVLHWLAQTVDEGRHAAWQRRTGHPLDECVQNQAALIDYLLELADEARQLIDAG